MQKIVSPFIQKQFDNFAMKFDLTPKGILHPSLRESGIVDVNAPPHQ
jgi:hypothetical protein